MTLDIELSSRQRAVLICVAVALSIAIVTMCAPMLASSATTLAGSAGTDTSLPNTDSAMTIKGRGRFASISVTVNQTKNLTNQAVSVSWTGAAPGTNVSSKFLQIFQCWGDDDGTNPDNPGPPPQQCEFGGEPITGVSSKIPSDAAPSLVYS